MQHITKIAQKMVSIDGHMLAYNDTGILGPIRQSVGFSRQAYRFSTLVFPPDAVIQTWRTSAYQGSRGSPTVQRSGSKVPIVDRRVPPPLDPQVCFGMSIKARSQKGCMCKLAQACTCTSEGTQILLRELKDRNYYPNQRLLAEKESLAARKVKNNLRSFLNLL